MDISKQQQTDCNKQSIALLYADLRLVFLCMMVQLRKDESRRQGVLAKSEVWCGMDCLFALCLVNPITLGVKVSV